MGGRTRRVRGQEFNDRIKIPIHLHEVEEHRNEALVSDVLLITRPRRLFFRPGSSPRHY